MVVIGAGPVGLAVAKALLQNGIPYEQLEGDDDLGGNWYHGVYETAHIISSRKTTEYADFPMPSNFPDFPSAQQMLEYLNSYAAAFNLREHIQFRTKVVMCLPEDSATATQQPAISNRHSVGPPATSAGSDKTLDIGLGTLGANGRWEVELAGGEKRVYKGVIVCSGHHWDKRFPNYPGEFTGEYIHSKDYKNPQQLVGKRVLVIGGGNSACDLASEAARVGRSSDLSLRRGYWFLPKVLFGVPIPELVAGWVPVWAQRIFLKIVLSVAVGKYEDYGLPKPDHRIFDAHPTLLYAGCTLPNHKNLYIVGTPQVRYGFGPLITPAAKLLCGLIKLQDQMELPIGLVLKESGAKLPTTHLVDPHKALRQMKFAKYTLPLLLRKERKLRQRIQPKAAAVKPASNQQVSPDMQIF